MIKRFEDIRSWKEARELNKIIYSLTNGKSFEKDYGLKDQIRRASVSISSNIAEGFGRNSRKEFARFLYIANGSCFEVMSQSYIAFDLNYINQEEFNLIRQKCEYIKHLIIALIQKLKQ